MPRRHGRTTEPHRASPAQPNQGAPTGAPAAPQQRAPIGETNVPAQLPKANGPTCSASPRVALFHGACAPLRPKARRARTRRSAQRFGRPRRGLGRPRRGPVRGAGRGARAAPPGWRREGPRRGSGPWTDTAHPDLSKTTHLTSSHASPPAINAGRRARPAQAPSIGQGTMAPGRAALEIPCLVKGGAPWYVPRTEGCRAPPCPTRPSPVGRRARRDDRPANGPPLAAWPPPPWPAARTPPTGAGPRPAPPLLPPPALPLSARPPPQAPRPRSRLPPPPAPPAGPEPRPCTRPTARP
ncbi:MAG: hypothetical protein RL071_2881 [Pseudomonadota bacterium]|jgi:hypothetical protein